MKAILKKLLRALRLDTLLLGLIEKLALGLVKKLSAIAASARTALDAISEERPPVCEP